MSMTTEVTNTSHFVYSIIAEILYKVPRRNLTVFFVTYPCTATWGWPGQCQLGAYFPLMRTW